MTVVDLTERERNRVYSPCTGCQAGWSSISQWTDSETKHLMEESTSCFDSCERLKETKETSPRKETIREIGRLTQRLIGHSPEPTNPDFYND